MSSFSNHNVTYRCSGIQQSLCPGAAATGSTGKSVRALLEEQFETLHGHAVRLKRRRNGDGNGFDKAKEEISLGRLRDVEEEEGYTSGFYEQQGEGYEDEDDEGDDEMGLGLFHLHEASWSYQQTSLLVDIDKQHSLSTNDDEESLRNSVGIHYHRRGRRLKGAPKGGKKGGGVKTARKRTSSGGGHDDYVNGTGRAIDDGGYPPADDLFKNTQGLGIEEFATFTDYVGELLVGR